MFVRTVQRFCNLRWLLIISKYIVYVIIVFNLNIKNLKLNWQQLDILLNMKRENIHQIPNWYPRTETLTKSYFRNGVGAVYFLLIFTVNINTKFSF